MTAQPDTTEPESVGALGCYFDPEPPEAGTLDQPTTDPNVSLSDDTITPERVTPQ